MNVDSKLESRRAALDVLGTVLKTRQPMDMVSARDDGFRGLAERERSFARNLATTTFRRLGQIDALIDVCLERPLPARAEDVRNLLRIGVCQLFFTNVADHAAVSTTVDLVRARGHTAHVKLVNAILRRLGRDGQELLDGQDELHLNVPDWLWRSWVEAYGEPICRRIAAAHLRGATLDLSPRNPSAPWAEQLNGQTLPMGTVRLPTGGQVASLPGFQSGEWWVQDAAARLVAGLAGEVRDRSVIDLCAAPGGKTCHFAAAGARVTAVDRSSKRLEKLSENLDRLNLSAAVIAENGETWRPDEAADVVFVDAPCTATGTARRHPDVLWLKSEDDVRSARAAQARLLAAAADMVRPGGRLIFATCSLQPEEGPGHVQEFLEKFPAFHVDAIDATDVHGMMDVIVGGGFFRSLPCTMDAEGGMDGFFAARFRRSK